MEDAKGPHMLDADDSSFLILLRLKLIETIQKFGALLLIEDCSFDMPLSLLAHLRPLEIDWGRAETFWYPYYFSAGKV